MSGHFLTTYKNLSESDPKSTTHFGREGSAGTRGVEGRAGCPAGSRAEQAPCFGTGSCFRRS